MAKQLRFQNDKITKIVCERFWLKQSLYSTGTNNVYRAIVYNVDKNS